MFVILRFRLSFLQGICVSSGRRAVRLWLQLKRETAIAGGERSRYSQIILNSWLKGYKIAKDRSLTDVRNQSVYAVIGAVFVGVFHLVTLLRIARHSGPIAMFYDDFFYYATAARSFLQLGYTTFDGQTHTNGYHPAWLVLLIQIMRFSGERFLYAAAVVICGLVALSTFLLARLCRLVGVLSGGSILCALVTVAFMIPVLGSGMEAALVAPVLLGFFLFAQSSSLAGAKQWFALGLLGALMILSRLDAAIFLILYLSLTASLERRSSHLLAAAAGLSPAALYFVYNRVVFGAFMTVSSMAKELRTTHIPSFLPVYGALHSILIVLYLTSLLGLLMYFVSGPGRIRRPLALAALLFPFVQLMALCFLSDWPLEVWYSYGLIVSFPVAVCILLQPVSELLQRTIRVSGMAGVALGLTVFVGLQVARGRAIRHDSIGSAAEQLARWCRTHPGKMAMGDRAGKVGWILYPGPLQLEGIMSDVPFLAHIRRQEDLRSVLSAYDIRYYIATNPASSNGCYDTLEPKRVGSTAMKLHGTFCSKPVLVYADAPKPGELPEESGPGPVTMVFDLHQN